MSRPHVDRADRRGTRVIAWARPRPAYPMRILALLFLAALGLVAFLIQRMGPHVLGDGIPDTPIEAHQLYIGSDR